MRTELIEVSPTQREIKIEIDAESLRDAYAKASQKYAKGVTVPGFRKGFAPLDVVRLRYKDEIKNDVLQQVLPQKVSEAVMEYDLRPLTEPQLHIDDADKISVNGSQPVKLHVHVEVMPEIPTPKYDEFAITRRQKPVADSEIEGLIAERLKEYAALIPAENRASETGDTVIADLTGRFADDPDGEPITAENLEVVIGDEAIDKAFTDNLAGVKPDEERQFTVTYPDDFSSAALAGKTLHYDAKIRSVGRMEIPAADDEWAVSLDEGYESMADLRKKVRADLESFAGSDADARVRNEAVAKLIEENAFEVPSTLIENQARNLLNNFAQDLQQRGVDLKKVENDFVTMAFEQMKAQAERDVRGAMLLDKIAEAEKVDVSDAEIEEEIGKIAAHYRTGPDEIRASLEKQGGAGTIANNLRTRKSIEALIAKAKVTDDEWIDESAETMSDAADNETEKPVEAKSSSSKTAKKKTAKTKA